MNTQAIVALSETPDGKLLTAVADYQSDPDDGTVSFFKIDSNSEILFGPVDLGSTATRSSPVDIAWDGNDAIIAYVAKPDFINYSIRTQKISETGQKLWSENGNTVFSRENKTLRVDLEKPDGAPARLALLIGRTSAKPETLLIGELTSSGTLENTPEFVAGGLTHDIFDPRAARIDQERLLVAWSDSRNDYGQDIYFQIVDGQGNSLLEEQGRKLTSHANNVEHPPAVIGDGSGGGFIAWSGVSESQEPYLHVQRISSDGSVLWSEAAQYDSPYGFEDNIVLVSDDASGVFVTFTKFNSSFVTRSCVMHVSGNGEQSWSSVIEFEADPNADATLYSAESDGHGGLFAAATTGPWVDTGVTVFHLEQDGSYGAGWSAAGLTFDSPNTRDRNPHLALISENVILTYDRNQGQSTYDIMGVLLSAEGSLLWGNEPRQLTGDHAATTGHQLSEDNAGGFLISWKDFRNGSHLKLYSSRFDASGNAVWPTGEVLACDFPGEINAPSLCHDGQGGAWMMWEDHRNSDDYGEIDLYATHLEPESGFPSTINGYTWPSGGAPVCDVPTYQLEGMLVPWENGSVMAVWLDQRSSNPGRCCGAGAVGDIYSNVYAQVLSEVSLPADEQVTVSILPDDFGISAVYPNPFNPSTKIEFNLLAASEIELSLFNVLGQRVDVLVSGRIEAGRHEKVWDASSFGTGLYFAQLKTADGQSNVRKLTLLK